MGNSLRPSAELGIGIFSQLAAILPGIVVLALRHGRQLSTSIGTQTGSNLRQWWLNR